MFRDKKKRRSSGSAPARKSAIRNPQSTIRNRYGQCQGICATLSQRKEHLMFVHSVYFWLNDDVSAEQRRQFRSELERLVGIETVECGFVGVPANTRFPVVDRTWDLGATMVFQDKAGHDAYVVHPQHEALLARYSSWWKKVVIYDSE